MSLKTVIREDLLASGRCWFRARYPGTCKHCGEPFTRGTAICIEVPRGYRAECCAAGGVR